MQIKMKAGRRWMALAAAAVLAWTAALPAMATPARWAPSTEMEDGSLVQPVSAGQDSLLNQDVATAKSTTPTEAAVQIKSPSAVLMEAGSGRVLFQKNAAERRNPASITKIMTLILGFDAIANGKVKMTDKVTVSEEAAAQVGTIIFADSGETFTYGDLLKSVAVGSANDAAVAVAEHVAGSVEAFVQLMNAKAKELGMNNTQFQNPTGLSAENHYTTAYDIALMGRYAAIYYPELIRLTSIYGDDLQVPWRKNGPTFRLWNNNKLLTWYPGADGLKTGWTEAAGYCLAATAVRGGVRMISVVMGAETWKLRNAEAAKLLDYGFSNYTAVQLAPKGKEIGQVSVSRGKVAQIAAVPREPFTVSVAKGQQGKVQSSVTLKKRVEAPVVKGQVLGEMVATLDGQEIARMELVAAAPVAKANAWEMMVGQLKRLFTLK